MAFGLIVIGDEILSGKRQDKHFAKVVELLATRGLQLSWVQYLGDDRPRLISALRHSFAGDDIVFSCGGIGATPDDHTRQSAAVALDVPLELHPGARDLIAQHMAEINQPLTPQRLRMGELPQGAELIPNPYNRIPGFSLKQHHFVPGFPVMAWPMIEWVLDHEYADRFNRNPSADAAILVWEGLESVLTPLMIRIEAEFPGLKVFSLPFLGSAEVRRNIELGVRGAPDRVPAAMELMRREVRALGYEFSEK
jgi:molybdopterin-biosynthesis enzyme MoeA-like protein